jgi:hypothetical protein
MKKKVPDLPKPTGEITQVSQYCLDVQPVTKFIESLPKSISIKHMRWCGYYRGLRKKLAIAEYLKEMGVHSARTTPEHSEIVGIFSDIGNSKMITNIKRIAKSYNIPEARFHIQTVQLKNKVAEASFKRQFKQIRLPNDKRRKKIVLGLVTSSGRESIPLLAKLSAKKITCNLAKVEKTIVMCSEEVVMSGKK